MQSTTWKRLLAREAGKEGRRKLQRVLVRQLRRRFGRTERTDAIAAGLSRCTQRGLDRVADLLVGSKPDPELLAAIERLVPDGS